MLYNYLSTNVLPKYKISCNFLLNSYLLYNDKCFQYFIGIYRHCNISELKNNHKIKNPV